MRNFEESLHTMLYGALVSYARVREFTIEDEAASFFVDRAFDRVLKRDDKYAQYSVAVSAIVNLPRFSTASKARPTRASSPAAALPRKRSTEFR